MLTGNVECKEKCRNRYGAPRAGENKYNQQYDDAVENNGLINNVIQKLFYDLYADLPTQIIGNYIGMQIMI